MRKQVFELDGRAVTLYTDDSPQILFLQPVDEHDMELLDAEIEAMRDCALPFALAAFEVRDWNRDLSPWEAPPIFGKVPFAGIAEETLSFVLDRLLPELRTRLAADMKLCIGGYSLAGLFALWAATRTDAFSGVAAASPSVWFPGWIDYVKANPIQTKAVWPRSAAAYASNTRSCRLITASHWNGIRAATFRTRRSAPREPSAGSQQRSVESMD